MITMPFAHFTLLVWSIPYFPYTHRLSGKDYIRLLNTFSYQHNLPTAVKDQLFQEIGTAISEAGGTIHLPYEAVLYLAQKKHGSS